MLRKDLLPRLQTYESHQEILGNRTATVDRQRRYVYADERRPHAKRSVEVWLQCVDWHRKSFHPRLQCAPASYRHELSYSSFRKSEGCSW